MKNTNEMMIERGLNPLGLPPKQGLYDPAFEHEACGVGFVCQMKGKKSHDIVRKGIQILNNLDHRGACGAEKNTGDGAGILMQMPDKFLRKVAKAQGFTLPKAGKYGAGIVFLPHDPEVRKQFQRDFDRIVSEEGQTVVAWRDLPVDGSMLGATAKASEPFMGMVFIKRGPACKDDMQFERKLYVIRKLAHTQIRNSGRKDCQYWYVASLSYKTLVYKGMLLTDQVSRYFKDLNDPDMESAMALVHSRFSTNTFPSWERGHPYRYIAHNGEINTLRGNINWMHARQA
ncbi:MAG TPA: glutamate synthase subunit alpha, partial [Verrucomicrobiae bacterium]|nr:glutamate synthase subunit alpha [Verrucomicrobiae bacterium]